MIQLYIFLFSLFLIAVVLIHRHWINVKEWQQAFKEKVAFRVEENRKNQEQEKEKESFKESFLKHQQKKSFDLKRYNQELSQAEMALAKAQWEAAKKHLIQAIAVAEDERKASLKLAKIYVQTQEYKRAESLYQKLTELDPQNSEVHQQLGMLWAQKKDYKRAIQAYVRAVELDEKNPEKLLALGKLYHLLMRYSVAGECFRRAAELKPREVSILFLLGEACQKDEDYENALRSFERILTLEPYNEKAKDALGEVKLKMGERGQF